MERPLILVTNDDGIESDGLWSAVEAVLPLGEVMVVAPDRQWSGGARSFPAYVTGRLLSTTITIDGHEVATHAVDASPALAVVHGVVELAPRRPSLVISGINFGANLGTEVTVSGTVGAALEAGAYGIPAIAVSLEMHSDHYLSGDENTDYGAAGAFTRVFAKKMLSQVMPSDVYAINVNVPSDATANTPWRTTRLSRCRYYLPTAPDRTNGHGRPGFTVITHYDRAEIGSDVRAISVDRVISVTPLSLDLTSRIDLATLEGCLQDESGDAPEMLQVASPPLIKPVAVAP